MNELKLDPNKDYKIRRKSDNWNYIHRSIS